MSDERIAKVREQLHEINKLAVRLKREQQELHDMIWKLRGNIMMM